MGMTSMNIELHSADSPKRKGYTAQSNDRIWKFSVKLDNGDILILHMGELTQKDFRAVILEFDIDDAVEGALNNGASENQD